MSPYVGAYWGPRQESLDGCADRASQFLRNLASLAPVFETWYLRGRSRRDALRHQVAPDRDAVRHLLSAGRNRRDSDASVIEELGYSIGLWNGREPSVGLRISCGKHVETANVKNVVLINLPRSDDDLDDLASREVVRGVMRLLVECWEPDWATWTTHEWREAQGGDPAEPVLGWMTYLSEELTADKLPPGVVMEPLGTGSLITTAEDVNGVNRDILVSMREVLRTQLRSVPVTTHNRLPRNRDASGSS